MDKNRVQGAIDDVAGRAKRQVGEWTGDTDAQIEGAAQQVKGKVEKAVGSVKDAVHKAEEKTDRGKQNDGERQHAYAVNRNSE